MSGTKRPAGKDFDLPSLQPKQQRVEPLLSQQGQGAGQQFVLPIRHPLDTTRRLLQPTRIIGIPGILPNVSRQPPPSTFAFPSPASSLSPLGLPVHSPLSTGGLVGISPNPMTGVPHVQPPHPPHLTIPTFPMGVASMGGTPHVQTPPAGVVALETPYIPQDHASSTGPLGLIRPGTPATLGLGGLPPCPLLAASPLAPPPPYPLGHLASIGAASAEEFTCESPSQFLRSPTSVTAISRTPSSTDESVASRSAAGNNLPGKEDGIKKESLPPVAPAPSVPPPLVTSSPTHPRSSSRRDHHSVKTRLLKHYKSRLATLKLRYEVQLKEMFFLEGGGNMTDFLQWKRKPNILREQYLKQHEIEAETTPIGLLSPGLSFSSGLKMGGSLSKMDTEHPLPEPSPAESPQKTGHKSSKAAGIGSRSGSVKQDTSSSTRIQIPLTSVSPSLQVVSPLPVSSASTPKSVTTPSSPLKSLQLSSPRPATRAQLQTQVSFSSVYETSHEDIVLRARHEAEVMRAIADLRKEGLWSSSRLPKVQEPGRKRVLWDFLLEEMQWLATDFANERRWKINAAKKVSG